MCETSVERSRPSDALLSIVLPVYNEQLVLAGLLDSLIEATTRTGLEYEIVFVNDGSQDESGRILNRLAAENRRVRVVHLSRNFGHQAAVQAGLVHARGDAVVLMDSDMQDAPSAIPRFVEKWQDGYDVVYAIRTERKENLPKRMLFAGFYRLLAAVSSVRIPLDAGNFGLIDRRVARQIVAMGERDRYYPGLRSWIGFKQIGIEVERNSRYDAKPRVSGWALCRLAKTAIFSFSFAPLAVFYWIGAGASAVLLGASLYAGYCGLWTGAGVAAGTWQVLQLALLTAINGWGIAVLGEYIARIYDQVRERPIYLVDGRVNFESHEKQRDFEVAYREAARLVSEAERDARRTLVAKQAEIEAVAEEDEYADLVNQVNQLLDTAIAAADRLESRPAQELLQRAASE